MRNWIILLAALLLFSSHVTVAAPGEGIGECAWGSKCRRGLDGVTDIGTIGLMNSRLDTKTYTALVTDPPTQFCSEDGTTACSADSECTGYCLGEGWIDMTGDVDTDETLGSMFIVTPLQDDSITYMSIDPVPEDDYEVGRTFCIKTAAGSSIASSLQMNPGSGDRFRIGTEVVAVDGAIKTVGACEDDDDNAGDPCDFVDDCTDVGDIPRCIGHDDVAMCFISRLTGGGGHVWITWGDADRWEAAP